jgi:glycosyltransferase involved in cell wall biosynthesis
VINLKISIALATFNGARFLKDQLASLVEQTFLPAELVVTDDGSTDETLAILEWFSHVAPFHVSVHLNHQRLGYGMNFLKAASLCSGGNRPLEPRALEVEFFPMEEVLHEKVKIHW